MLRLFITEHCSINIWDHWKDNLKNCLSYKKGGKLQLRCSKSRLWNIMGWNMLWPRLNFLPLSN